MYFPFQSYRQAIALSPNMLNAHMNLGALLHIRVSAQLHICPVGVACRQVIDERIRMSSPFSNKWHKDCCSYNIPNVANRERKPLAEDESTA